MISVCMTSHNGEKYIKQQIDSILSQLSAEDELIISDDGSDDNTIDIIKGINDKRIRLLNFQHELSYSHRYLPAYYYASANFNNALIEARGDIIFIADQDDIWHSDKIKRCLKELETHDIVCHNFDVIDVDGNILETSHLPKGIYDDLGFFGYLKHLPFRGCCLAFNRKVYELSVPLPKSTFEHDCWIGMMSIAHNMKYTFIDEPLIGYRRHSINISELESPNGLLFKLQYRSRLLVKMALRILRII